MNNNKHRRRFDVFKWFFLKPVSFVCFFLVSFKKRALPFSQNVIRTSGSTFSPLYISVLKFTPHLPSNSQSIQPQILLKFLTRFLNLFNTRSPILRVLPKQLLLTTAPYIHLRSAHFTGYFHRYWILVNAGNCYISVWENGEDGGTGCVAFLVASCEGMLEGDFFRIELVFSRVVVELFLLYI